MTRSLRVVVLALALVAGAVAPARAGAPTDQVREYTEAVLKVLEDPSLKAEDKKPERRAAVRKIATEVFDVQRSEEHTSELQSLAYLVCRLLLEKKNKTVRY